MIIRLVGISFITVILSVIMKKQSPQYAMAVSVAGGVIIIAMVLGDVTSVIETVRDFSLKSGVSEKHLVLLIKVIGIAYLTEFTADIAKDAGENAIASKIQFGGKITILSICTPIIINLLTMITGLLP